MPQMGIWGEKRAHGNISAFGLKPLLPARKLRVCHAIASGWPRRPTSPLTLFLFD